MKGRQTNEELAVEMASVLDEYGLNVDKVTNIVTDGCAAFTKSFRRFGVCDRLATSGEIEIEDVPSDDFDDIDAIEAETSMPFIQNEDGELFVSNVLTFAFGEFSIERLR